MQETQMSEMVERVARAIFEESEDYRWEDFANADPTSSAAIVAGVTRQRARAAIAAMREPTEKMLPQTWMEAEQYRYAWTKMIDAALR
jgi:hypothetical protein